MSSTSPLLRLTILGSMTVLALACGDRPTSSNEHTAQLEAETEQLETVPRPSLTEVDTRVREQLEAAHQGLDELLAAGAEEARLAESFGHLGRLYHAYDLLSPASACYRNARRLEPENDRWPALLGTVYQRQGALAEAAAELAAARDLNPTSAAISWRLGQVEQARGRRAAAREAYGRALEREPLCEAARFGLAELDAADGELEEAVRRYKTVLVNQPGAVSVHYPLAQVLGRLGRADEAKTHLQIAASRQVEVGGRATCPDPLDAELATLRTGAAAHLALGRRAAFAGQSEIELAEYRKALEIAPDDAVVRQSLGEALARQGELEEALEQYQEAARLQPQNADFQQDIGIIASRLGRLDRALQAFEKAIELRPGSTTAHWLLAQLLQLQGRPEAAVERYDAVLQLDPLHAEARTGRALALAQLGRSEEARLALASLLDEQPPADPTERFNLASGIGAMGDFERAVQHFEWVAANAQEPSLRGQAFLRAALLLERGGRIAEAVERLRSALVEDPQLTPAREGLERLTGG